MALLDLDTFTRANNASNWGTASGGSVWSTASGSAVLSIASNEGHAATCTSATFMKLGSGSSVNAEALVRVRASDSNATSSGIVLRATGTTTYYRARLSINNASLGIALIKVIAGTSTNLFTASFTQTANTYYWLRFRCVGSSLYAKVWADGSGEPASWTISGTDTSITATGNFGLHTNSGSSTTTWDFDSFTVTDSVGYHDASSRFRLLATKSVDALARFRLLATKSVDALTRFRLQSGTTYHDALTRFRLQSGTTNHDASSRFRLQSGTTNHDALARFRLLAAKSVDALGRFRLQSGTTYHDASARFRLQSTGQRAIDALARFRLQSGTTTHDGLARFRLLATKSIDVLARFGLLGPSSYKSAILVDSPQAYYRLGEASGTTANDSSGNGYNGTLSGTVTLSQAGALEQDTNKAMLFDGSSGYVALASGMSTSGYSALTVELWMNLANTSFGQNARILANDHTDSNNKGFQLAVNAGGAGGFFGLGFGSYQVGADFSGSFSANTWYHLVATYDGTTIQLYVNGVANGSATVGGSIAAAGFPINIGRNPAYAGDYFPGTLDEIAIYSVALSASRVASHYVSGRSADAMTRFRLLATTTRDAISRFRLQSGVGQHDASGRFRLQSGTQFKNSMARFRLQSGVTLHDGLARFRLQSGVANHDAPGRFRLSSATQGLNALARFRLLATKSVDVLARFRLQSGVIQHDASARFRLTVPGQQTKDALARFRLLAFKSVDTLARFRLQSGLQQKDAPGRFRLLAPVSRDTSARFRVQSGLTQHDVSSRFRLSSSAIMLNALMRFRLQANTLRMVAARFRLQSGLIQHDARARFRLGTSSARSMDAAARFGLIVGTHRTITLQAPRGNVTLTAPHGTITLEAAS
jgi:hypothetical protein